ncbi:ATP-binding protein [Asaia sp. VD9]|uniref:hybrid sensor histidine kinase/response regulator n=1 Tax=Asaia sp. VD9 TaxID=3081235 RepID=UPI003015A4E4
MKMPLNTPLRGDTARLRIVRMRRDYNAWVADQSTEDYALRFTARSARAATPWRAALTALGSISFMALEAVGATLTLAFGFGNVALAVLVVCVVIFLVSLPITIAAARSGLDIDLLTRGTGFGYIGSTLTSLIYASFTFIFFGIETAILAAMLARIDSLPTWLTNVIAALIVIPLATGGFRFLARFQSLTMPVWFALNTVPLVAVLWLHPEWIGSWVGFSPPSVQGVSLIAVGSAASVMMVLICQSAEQVDFLRFLPERSGRNRIAWWASALIGGPGWVVLDAVKILAGSFLACAALRLGMAPDDATQPQALYTLAYGTLLPPPLALTATFFLILVAQTRINLTNAYAGSLAWSNFFSRLTHGHPGRVFYIFFTIGMALVLLESGIVNSIQTGLVFYAVLAASWMGAIVSDLVLCKPLGLSPPRIEFRRAALPDINPVGLGAMLAGVGLGLAALSGVLGAIAHAFAPFMALGMALCVAPLIAAGTGGRTYLARRLPRSRAQDRAQDRALTCVICERVYEAPDMAHCPAYGGAICSLCCSLDARCHDRCKPPATRLAAQITRPLDYLPPFVGRALRHPAGRFALIFALVFTMLGSVALSSFARNHPYLLLGMGAAIGSMLAVLAQQSQRAAREETTRQTQLLLNEIAAHERTDAALIRAREKAEAASHAKTRFLSGISHEIRAPLNTIMGYAQILEADPRLPPDRLNALRTIRESGDHMTALLTGLLDISRIEAGRIEIYRDRIPFAQFLDSVVQMVRPQAAAKGLEFVYKPGTLPQMVNGDAHRLRQILLNLLSNAIKFTESGRVTLSVIWQRQIAEFVIEDTGPGIAPEDHERIFEPFERAAGDAIPGTGLGLTITRLLTEIMGGELTFTASQENASHGTRFRVRLFLSDREETAAPRLTQLPVAYEGKPRRILVVDDNPRHCEMLTEMLAPRGFEVESAANARDCLERLARFSPHLLLLDLSMPGMNGRDLALSIRETHVGALPIIFITGNMAELAAQRVSSLDDCPVLGKPVDFVALFEAMGRLLGLEWTLRARRDDSPVPAPVTRSHPDPSPAIADAQTALPHGAADASAGQVLPNVARLRLLHHLERGDLRGFRVALEDLAGAHPALEPLLHPLREAAGGYRLAELSALLGGERP